MIAKHFDTAGLPPEDRFPFWHELTAQSYFASWASSPDADDFLASVSGLDLGDVRVQVMTMPPVDCRRTPKLVRSDDPEQYMLGLFLDGDGTIDLARESAPIRPGAFFLIDSSQPFRSRNGRSTVLSVHLPRSAVAPHVRSARGPGVRVFPAAGGVPGVLGRYLTELVRESAEYSAADRTHLAAATTSLVSAALAQWLGEREPERSRDQVLLLRIHDFIEEHLGDPGLSPRTVAERHQLSVRQLHRVFGSSGQSVAAHIRSRRLERCRFDLADPSLGARSIQAIAARWGFGSPSHFSTVFRDAYGVSPSDVREAAAFDPGTETQGPGTRTKDERRSSWSAGRTRRAFVRLHDGLPSNL
ncbi:helix-turn-helix domain-containing protein [Actinocorallia longicatena]|uniref:Helix-turn-helix domain-containing protein n=1 Tax=Actinocorallia longicatena TaxID=111803 RepID=A0ABP6QHR4_9ACTN